MSQKFDISPTELSKWMRDCFECPLVGQVKDKVIPTLEGFGGPAGLCVKLSTASNTGIKKDQVHTRGGFPITSIPFGRAQGTHLMQHTLSPTWWHVPDPPALSSPPPGTSCTPCRDAACPAGRSEGQHLKVSAWLFPFHWLLESRTLPFHLLTRFPSCIQPHGKMPGRKGGVL